MPHTLLLPPSTASRRGRGEWSDVGLDADLLHALEDPERLARLRGAGARGDGGVVPAVGAHAEKTECKTLPAT